MIPHQPSRIADLLKGFPGDVTSHVCRLAGREKRLAADVVDLLLPLFARLRSRVDKFQPLPVNRLDGVSDPAALHFDAGGTVAEESRPVRAVEVEHIGVSWDGGAEVGELEVATC